MIGIILVIMHYNCGNKAKENNDLGVKEKGIGGS